ncbi:MAG: magnesium transporter [Bryobacterales bacterium]|nr:magnesium transporter [Bryobacterales bacterium]
MVSEQALILAFVGEHTADAARILERLPAGDAAALLTELPPEPASEVVRRMSAFAGSTAIAAMDIQAAASLIAHMPHQDASSLLRRVEATVREGLIAALPDHMRDRLRVLLRYPEGTAGALMDPFVLVLPGDLTAGEALSRVRHRARHVYFYVYVTDRSHKLAGVLDLRELLLARASDTLTSVMRSDLAKVLADTDVITVQSHPGWQEYDALPVVDEGGVFLGAIRHRSVRRIQTGDGRPAVAVGDTMLSLAELYWIGIGGMLRGLTGAVAVGNAAGGRNDAL